MTISPAETHLDVRVVVHTHWDREWYRPEPRFRQRLVALVDELLDRSAGEPVLLDGQAVLLEDYLSVRPDRAAELSGALRRGSLEAGPWYVLADELIPSGEGLVRNLLAGRRTLGAVRAAPPAVLYCPDSFGHPAALPAIAAGFGCPVIILWRGYGGRTHPPGDVARWVAPDGSAALLYHLPPDGYEFGSHLPVAPEDARLRWDAMRVVLADRATTGVVILTAGADHHAPPPDVGSAIDALAVAARPDLVTRSSLGAASDALVRQAGRARPAVAGELRDSYGYAWTLQGTLGSRAGDKRRYRRVERALVRDLEPWVALAPRAPAGRDRRHLLAAAWRPLLHCQPHDTLCGCSMDEVAAAMRARLAESEQAAEELRDAAIADLLGHDPVAARGRSEAWTPFVVVRNPSARRRGGIAEVTIDSVLAESPVGPASAGVAVEPRPAPPVSLGRPPLPMQLLDSARTFAREESPRHYPRNRLVERRRVLVSVPEMDGHGLATIPIAERRRRPASPIDAASGSRGAIRNGCARVQHGAAGLALTWHDGRHVEDWIAIEAEGERGDLYTASPMPGTRVVTGPARSRVTARGPLRAALTTDWRVRIPGRRLTSAAGVERVVPRAELRLRTVIQLDAGAGFARVLVRGDNTTTDLRLRVVFRTGVADPLVRADAAFATVRRSAPVAAEAAGEVAPPTAPLHRYVTLSSAERGATLFSDGLAEYEARADGAVAVTLFRAVGELSRHDLPERPGHAGWPVETPEAQQQGTFEAAFGFTLHGPWSDRAATDIESMADDVLLPLTGETWRCLIAPPARVRGVELHGPGLAVSAIKPADDGDGMVLRCVNLLDRVVAGAWDVPGLRNADLVRLDETSLGALSVEGDRVAFSAQPRAIVSVRAR